MDFAIPDSPSNASLPEHDDDEQDFGNVIPACTVAFDYHNKTLGMAYYMSETKALFVSSDLHEVLPFNQWQTAGLQIEPDYVLISSRAHDTLDEEKGHHVVLKRPELRPKSEFSSKTAIDRLITIFNQEEAYYDAEADVVHDSREATRVKLRGVLDCDATLSLGCVNVLLTFIQSRRRTAEYSKEEFLVIMVQSIDMFRLKATMLLNADTFYALNVFETPMKDKSAGKISFENLTLFSLLCSCVTSHGKALLKHWFLTPSTDLAVLASRHDAIDCFLMPSNFHAATKITKALRKCHDMVKAMHQLQQGDYGSSSGSVWQSILSFALNTIKIVDLTSDMSELHLVPIFAQVSQSEVITRLESIAALINDVIDFDESEVEGRVVVKRLVDELLDERVDKFDGIEKTLNKVESEIALTVPDEFAELVRCVYMPQLGFHIIMPLAETERASTGEVKPPIYQSPTWEAKFSSNEQWYFKNAKMVEMDEYFGDLHSLVVDREIELLHQLQMRVLEASNLLTDLSGLLSELDCLLCLANAARKYNYVRPEMTEENILKIKDGRHPLLEHLVDIYVPNDLRCAGYDLNEVSSCNPPIPNAIIMTGANFSGKSVYLKQTALIVYMAHIGSFVPASSALIGVTDRILTRLARRNTVAKGESSFLKDLQQVSYALKMLTPRSLVLIDEFGKSTDEISGPALFGGLIAYLTEPDAVRPKSLLTTHFHDIVQPKYLPEYQDAFVLKHMQIVIDPQKQELKDQITYLFKLADGASNSSFGIHCAALGGMPQEILDRAQYFQDILARGDRLEDVLLVLSDKEKEELKEAEAMAKRFFNWDMEAEPDETFMSKLKEVVLGPTDETSRDSSPL